jgi:hypothetical protein
MLRFTQTLLAAAVVAGAAGFGASAAMADDRDDFRCAAVPRADWMSVADITAKATSLGYEVRGVEADDGCWEIKARDKDRREVDLHFDPVTAKLVHTNYDD